MSKRKLSWLVLAAFPTILMSGCWATLHQLAIHGFEFVGFFADIKTLTVL